MKSIAKISLVTAFLALGVSAVAAQPYVPRPADTQITSDNVLLADYKYNNKYNNKKYNNKKYKNKKWVYSKKYGNRYRYKRNGYIYYYNGWWYPRPYWRYDPGITIHLGL